ncbi:MAG: hypothetical protein ABR950_09105 [Candidatus Dormibacteria bacterium]|jgi:hypothetical protein
MSTLSQRPPLGSVALRMHIFGPADQELAATMAPPWPVWMRHLYELHALQSSHVDVIAGEVPVSAALAALQSHLAHRLGMIGFVCSHLEEMGWEISLTGPDLVAHRVTAPGMAREALAARHLESALLAVGDVDEHGAIRLYEPWELGPAAGDARPTGEAAREAGARSGEDGRG